MSRCRFSSPGFGRPETAARALLAAYAESRTWPGKTIGEQHGICGYGCGCKQRPKDWPRTPPIHPRVEECHP